jgi:hypothetical protein
MKAEADFAAEDDARTCERAHEIMGDKKRMKGVHKHLTKRMSAMKQMQKQMPGKH